MDTHSTLNGFPQALDGEEGSPASLLLLSESASSSSSSRSASQNIVPRAESSMIRPLGVNSLAGVGIAFGSSGSSTVCAIGANSMAAAGSSLILDAIRA